LYLATKQLTKFAIAGFTAVFCDLLVYYILSSFLPTDLSKALGFISGTFVTYNINKFWTWRQNDRNTRRLMNFLLLYAVSMVVNVAINSYALGLIPDYEILLQLRFTMDDITPLATFKADKFTAFVIATVFSSIVNFLGQKYWVFKEVNEDNETTKTESK
jgi:putative flippase GtrA